MIDPQAAALIANLVAQGVPPLYTLTPQAAREAYRRRARLTQAAPTALAEVRDLDWPGPAGASRARLYRPALDRLLPGLLYLHGGGWTIGDLDTHDVVCRDLAAGSGCAVVALDYRLAPEHPFPAAADDTLAGWRWLHAAAGGLGIDAGRIAVGGDSAGGNLAAGVCLDLRDAGEAVPAFQLLIYPSTDQRAVAPSHTSNGQGYLLTRETVDYYRDNYLPDPATRVDPRTSPLLHRDLGCLPPALVLTAGFDPLRDEGLQYADALSAAGVATQYVCFERQIHGFITMGGAIGEAATALALCAAALRTALATDPDFGR